MSAETAIVVDVIAGARPHFMKIAPIIRAREARRAAAGPLRCRQIHAGHCHDARLSEACFARRGNPEPDVARGAGICSGDRAVPEGIDRIVAGAGTSRLLSANGSANGNLRGADQCNAPAPEGLRA